MPDHIDFEAKSDRDLIILTAQTCNNISDRLTNIDILLLNHEKRIVTLETTERVEHGNDPMSKAKMAGWGSGIFIFGSLIGSVLYAFGKAMKWW